MINTKRNLHLSLLQAEQYDTQRYLVGRKSINPALISRMKMTGRLKLTKTLSYLLGIVGANILIGASVTVYEKLIWLSVQRKIAVLKSRGLKVVAIAGSYGKTSVKHAVYESLRHTYRVVATPESFNTVLGIAKCLDYEVDEKTEVFIVEVGAYHIGDITHLLQMVQPDIGVLTGMARQHLERFGSFENIVQAKSEIAVHMENMQGPLIANGSDRHVVEAVQKIGGKYTFYDGLSRDEINLNAGKLVARNLGVSEPILKKIKIRPTKNRFEMTTDRYGMAVIDDSFSSNDKGFESAIDYLSKQKKYFRILVTPGLVELGEQSNQIHEELGGKLVGKADLVILVGHSDRTLSLEKGIARKLEVRHIEKTLDFMPLVKSLKLKKEPLVLLENDITENY